MRHYIYTRAERSPGSWRMDREYHCEPTWRGIRKYLRDAKSRGCRIEVYRDRYTGKRRWSRG